MRQLFVGGAITRLAAGATALAAMLVFSGCASSMNAPLETPVLTPAGGAFNAAQTVTVSDTTPGAVLHCTTDGSAPTASSPVCPQPVTVYKTETLGAVAVAPDGSVSGAVSATYTINLTQAATPVIAPAAGTYTAAQSVTITDTTPNAAIYYTTDGSTPTTSSMLYVGPINVTAAGTTTINAVAISSATTLSAAATAAFTINYPAATPIFSIGGAPTTGGAFTAVQAVSITDATPNATIYYTTDGSMPAVTGSAATHTYMAPIPLSASGSVTINAIAIAQGSSVSAVATATFTLNLTAATPVISPAGGTFTTVQTATITDTTPGATIYYTTDGSMPTTSSRQYAAAIQVTNSETINAIAVAAGYANSAIATAAFTLNLPAAPAPTFSPAAGIYTSIQTVAISDSVAGASIYYTTNGSTPAASSTLYSAPINVAATETLKAVAIATGYSLSPAASAIYTINLPPAATPVISPASGTFTTSQTVTITDATAGASIYYTLDGTIPTASSLKYSAPISVSATETVKAIAVATGYSSSAVATAVLTFTLPAAATPVIAPNGGTFSTAQTVSITDATAGATIYYTLDGSTPTIASTKYAGSITVAASETIRAIAAASGHNNSAVASATFTINQPAAATPVISPAGGTFATGTAQTVTLSDSAAGAVLYYTTDGSTPTTNSTKYTAPFLTATTGSETIKAIATAAGFSTSAVASATFTFTTVTGIPLSGTVSSGTHAVSGASVQLYAAGTAGYASVPTALLSTPVTTGANGGFLLSYSACPAAPGDQLYLVSTGGSAGGGTNSEIVLMTALGSCSSLTSGETVVVNEVTTIASVYALAQFSAVTATSGIDVGAPAPSAACTSTAANTCNYIGLANAFKTVSNLVDIITGAARTVTPFYAANPVAFLNTSTVPQARINTLANIVASCVEATTNCASLFTASKPPALAGPKDTLQAALDIAQNPGNDVATLFGLTATTPPYTPDLSTAPNDFALTISFTGGGLGLPHSNTKPPFTNTDLDIDAGGNILVTAFEPNPSSNRPLSSIVAEFNNLGAATSPATVENGSPVTITYGGFNLSAFSSISGASFNEPESLVIDQSGTFWIDNMSTLLGISASELAQANSGTPATPVTVGINNTNNPNSSNLSIDSTGNVWLADSTSLSTEPSILEEASPSGTLLSPTAPGIFADGWNGASGSSSTTYSDVTHITFDSSGNTIWASDLGSGKDFYQISTETTTTSPTKKKGSIFHDYAFNSPAATKVFTHLVADSLGNIYGCASGTGLGLDTFNASTTNIVATHAIATGRGCSGSNTQLVIDGGGHIFASHAAQIVIYDPSGQTIVAQPEVGFLDEFTTNGASISPVTMGYVGSSYEEVNNTAYAGSDQVGISSSPIGLRVDGSGNLWTLNPSTGSPSQYGDVLVEFIGIAAPIQTPLSLALSNGELASRP